MKNLIKIYVYQGVVSKVENIPEGYKYIIIDEDILDEDVLY